MLSARLIVTTVAATALNAMAQDSLLLRDYQFVKQSDPWLTAANPAALTRYDSPNMALATLSVSHGKGGLVNFNESTNRMELNAGAESFIRLNPHTVVYGSIAYDNFSGRNMTGSTFIDPARKPFDLVEDSLGNTGTKHRDTYQLCGAVGTKLGNIASLGLSFDYTAANYAKYKDLRHKNKLMDLKFTAAVYVPLGNSVQMGACYQYHRNTESLLFSTYGKNDRTYNTFINYGPYIGHVEQFGNAGYTEKGREMPLADDYDGIGLQMAIGPQHGLLSFYHAVGYAHRRGYYGRRSPFTITHSRHHSHTYSYQARITLSPNPGADSERHSLFTLDLRVEAENLENNARNYRELQNENGATYYQYYDDVKTANRLWVDGAASLAAHLGVRQQLPTWSIEGGLQWQHRKQTAYLYPYFRRQRLTSYEPFVALCRNMVGRHGLWTLKANAAFRHGSSDPYTDGTLATPSDKQTPPPSQDACLWREYQWLMAAQYAVGASVRYSFVVPSTRLKTSLQLAVSHRKANESFPYSTGSDHTTLEATLGCEF